MQGVTARDEQGAGAAPEPLDWTAELASLRDADVSTALDPERLERLATVAYLSGHDQESSDAWVRCYQVRLDRNEPEAALRCAFWLGFGLMQRGDVAQGGGWLAQAGHLASERDLDCAERGYLLVPAALMSLNSGALDDALDQFEQAGVVAEQFDDDDLRAFSYLGRGQALSSMGRWDDGVRLFDRAMTAVTSGIVSPVVAGIVYCAVIDQCQEAFDIRRSHEWTDALSRWCDRQSGLVPFRGQCLVHRSHVLRVHGAWSEAIDEARRARDRLSDPPHPAMGMAFYELGELHRLRGELALAEAAYERAQEAGRLAQPGLALVRLSQGRIDAAVAAIDTALAGSTDSVTRARLLPAFVEIMLVAGRIEAAGAGVDELAGLAQRADVLFLEAAALHAAAAVSLAAGDARSAMGGLRAAQTMWERLEVPYETARTRRLIAEACMALGDAETAEFEADAARQIFADLGAPPDLARVEGLLGGQQEAKAEGTMVSPRELQVLRRVARGMTNQDIASDLFISIKTVERHVSNIFTKLDVANRAEATARSYENGIL
jgi:DNA-binding CsgD family transcriptional regulator